MSQRYMDIPGIDSDLYSICSGTNSTASNRTGVGRVVGNLISKGGRRIEAFAGSIASRLGYGPTQALVRILAHREVSCESHTDLTWRRYRAHNLARNPSTEMLLAYLETFDCYTCEMMFYEAASSEPSFSVDTNVLEGFLSHPNACVQLAAINYIVLLIDFIPLFETCFPCFRLLLDTARREAAFRRPEEAQLVKPAVVWALRWLDKRAQSSYQNPRPYGGLQILNELLNDLLGQKLPLVLLYQMRIFSSGTVWKGSIPISLFPSRSMVADIIERFSTYTFEWGFVCTFLDALQDWLVSTRKDTSEWRNTAADFSIAVLLRTAFYRREGDWNVRPMLKVLPQIAPDVEHDLFAEGQSLVHDHDIELQPTERPSLIGLINSLRWHSGLLPPPIILWMGRVIDALGTPWIPLPK